MKRALIAYFSLSGYTEKMAGYIAEGIRISGNEAEAKRVAAIKSVEDLAPARTTGGYSAKCSPPDGTAINLFQSVVRPEEP
jgi:flavodoxin